MFSSLASPHRTAGRRERVHRLLVAVLLAPALLLLLGVAGALGAPGTMRLIDTAPSFGQWITIASPGGGTFQADPGRALVRVTPLGGSALETYAWCIDARRAIDDGIDYPVDLATSADIPELAGPAAQEAAWLIGRADGLIAAAAAPGLEAAAIQVAVWQLTGQAADVAPVTGDAALNARVAELRALAQGRTPAVSIALSGPGSALTPGAAATVVVTGTPGAQVALEVTGGAASLSATAVTLDAAGRADVVVTPSAGEVVLTARAEGGLLRRAAHLPGRPEPQDMAYVTPVVLAATTTIAVAAAPTAPVVIAPTVSAVPAKTVPRAAALRLVKRAPARVLRGRTISYRLTVINASPRTARRVVVRDRLPAGTFLARVPARARLVRGTVIWRLGNLAPRRRVTVRMRLRTVPAASPVIRNVARASAANAATVRARAVTRLRPRVRPAVAPARVSPAVTG